MAETAKAKKEVQAPWNCMWVRLGHPFVGFARWDQPDDLWLCVRPPGPARYVTEEECAGCRFWELDQPES